MAAIHAGVTPVWASEIDDFPAAVTAYHFPDMVQLGDITKINVDKLEPVDIICAGSPCQDLSVAGKREGLAGERSGLFRTAIDIVHRLRNRTGMPRYFVWENVPGAFSSNKGLDFAAVLSEITKTEIPMPKDNKWAEAGVVEWDGGSLAWRVLDAQYWGVPQRRKRIFLVADFGGHSAGEILFESQGVPKDFTQSKGEREETAGNVGTSVDCASGTLTPWDVQSNRIQSINGKAAALYGGAGQGTHNGAVFDIRHIDSTSKVAYSFDSKASNSMKSANPYSGCRQVEIAKCLDTTVPDPSKNQGGIAIYDMTKTAFREGSFGSFIADNIAGTAKGEMCDMWETSKGSWLLRETFTEIQKIWESFNVESRRQTKTVRRLTPLEAERLQGLPDGYTDIEFNGKPAPDSRRYKAIGNGMAQPVADFVIKRIVEVANSKGKTI